MSFIYLASPYTHADLAVMKQRHEQACQAAAYLMGQGYAVFSPIAHSHPLADHMPEKLRTDFEFWMGQDLPLLKHASEMRILAIDGWQTSRGVNRELRYATELGIPVKFIFV